MKGANDLIARVARLCPNRLASIDNPYAHLDGRYEVELIDLVKESDDYDSAGLLCWMPNVGTFGCVDEEHSTVLSFPDSTWPDIVRHPVEHLDSQWGLGSVPVEETLPWLWFDFRLKDRDLVLSPYPDACPFHQEALTIDHSPSPVLLRVYRRREPTAWLDNHVGTFPCSGVPVSERETKCCSRCRNLELDWMGAVANAIPEADAKLNSQGWIQCPGCGVRFSTMDEARFQFGTHLACGQRIRLIS
ncbi:MAG TPA: hypothetical protein VFV87_05205 [Pirellulaceae bacterium]|nr:hypothetical protein [Pirellulaceae bacterium]